MEGTTGTLTSAPDRGYRAALVIGLGVVLLAAALYVVGPDRLWRALAQARPGALAAAGLLVVALILARGVLWSVLLGRGGRGIVVLAAAATGVGWLMGHLFPLHAGLFVRAGIVARKARIPLASVVASLAIERGLDLVVTALLAVVVTIVAGGRVGAPFLPFLAASIVVLACLAIGGLVVARSPAPFLRRVPRRLAAKVEGFLAAFRDGIRDVAADRRRVAAAFLAMGLVAVLQVAFLAALVHAFLPDLSWHVLAVGVPWLALSFFLAFTPSHIGTFEGAFAVIFVQLGVPLESALTTALLVHAAMVAFALAVGAAAWPVASARGVR